MLSAVARNRLGVHYRAGANQDHLAATIAWLCAAQDATAENGVSAFYDVRAGAWAPSYPETTGYIIPTFCDYAVYSGDVSYLDRAVRMTNWLLTLQLENGAFPIGPLWPEWERIPIIFDTGQIIQGLVRVYDETGESSYLAAAKRAGDWLADVADADGCWRTFTSLGHVHTYNVRICLGLAATSQGQPGRKTPKRGCAQPGMGADPAGARWLVTQCGLHARRRPVDAHDCLHHRRPPRVG